jgi:hypothetical protein
MLEWDFIRARIVGWSAWQVCGRAGANGSNYKSAEIAEGTHEQGGGPASGTPGTRMNSKHPNETNQRQLQLQPQLQLHLQLQSQGELLRH